MDNFSMQWKKLTPITKASVLSHVLLSLHTNEMQIMNSPCQLYKCADDMVLVGLMQTGDTVNQSTHLHHVGELTKRCEDCALFINESKTKELVTVSHRKACHYLPPALINDQINDPSKQ